MIRPLIVPVLFSLAAVGQTPAAFCVDTNADELFSLDLQTGVVTLIASTANNNLETPADLCWRDDSGELWTVDLGGGEIGTIDPATGQFSQVATAPISGWQGMAWDHTTGLFFLHSQNDELYTFEPVTLAVTLVGSLANSGTLVTAIEIDGGGRLWAADFAGGLIELDKATGTELQSIATPGVTNLQSLSIDAEGTWWGISTQTDSLYVIDPASGASVLIGPNTGTTFVKGMCITGSEVQRFGLGCADGNGEVRLMTSSGSTNLGGVSMQGVTAGTMALPMLLSYGLSASTQLGVPLPADLSGIGAPGCSLYVSLDAVIGGLVTGTSFPFVIPNNPANVGFTMFVQGVLLDFSPGANAANLALTDAIKVTVVP